MNLDKSQKRIAKKVKKGFQGYPQIAINYYGPNDSLATKVVVGFTGEAGGETLFEQFNTATEIRTDEMVQTTIIKIIDRCDPKTVLMSDTIQGCPHEAGVDFDQGESCPKCVFWQS